MVGRSRVLSRNVEQHRRLRAFPENSSLLHEPILNCIQAKVLAICEVFDPRIRGHSQHTASQRGRPDYDTIRLLRNACGPENDY
jgi:hypothetical protein